MPRKVHEFSEDALRANGFKGWLKFAEARANLACPKAGGVYVVSFFGDDPPAFEAASCGGWFKGRNPTVPFVSLRENWVPEARIVYIGKADVLARRIREFADFGAGKAIGHWGGRLIWQLPRPAETLRIAWKETPDEVPVAVEGELIAQFRAAYGKPPFANAPHMLGR